MSSIWVLMGLLLLSYIGSFLVSGRMVRGVGLPSGSEYVVLGFVLGPYVLGLMDRSTLGGFESVANVSLGWLALIIGLEYGFVGLRRVSLSRMALGRTVSLVTGGMVAAAVWAVIPLRGTERFLLAGGVGAACAETTRHAVQWVVPRYRAGGKVAGLFADLSSADDFVPLLGMGVVFAMSPSAAAIWPLPVWAWTGVTGGVGLLLGIIAVVLLGSDFRLIQSWGVLIGTSLLLIGATARTGLSPLFAAFVMGMAIASLSRHREEIVAMVAPTERPVLLPALLLAGAHVNLKTAPYLPWVLAAAIGARALGKVVMGLLVRLAVRDARPAGPAFGFGLMSSGAVAMATGLAFALRFPGPVGDTVLASAAAVTLFGEFVGPAALRSTLRQVGEIVEPSDATDDTPLPGAETPPPSEVAR